MSRLSKTLQPLVKFIGRLAVDALLALIGLSVALGIFQRVSHLELTLAFQIILAVMVGVIIIGYLITQPSDPLHPIDGLIAGFRSGLLASLVGGAVYYLCYRGYCQTDSAATKIARLVPSCTIIGAILGAVVGLTRTEGPVWKETVSTRKKAKPDHDKKTQTIINFSLFFACLIIIIYLAIDYLSAPTKRIGGKFVGEPQSNMVFWQYVVIIAVFTMSFVYYTVKKYGWSDLNNAQGHLAWMAKLSFFATGCSVLVGGVPLGVSLHGLELTARECGTSSAEAQYLPAWFQVALFFFWTSTCYYLGTSGQSPILRYLAKHYPWRDR